MGGRLEITLFPYFILIGLPALFAFVKVKKNGESVQTKAPIHLFFAIFIFLLAMKDLKVGVDTENYYIFFKEALLRPVSYVVDKHGVEWGYHLFEVVLSRISSSFQVYLGAVALVAASPIWYFYAKESKNPYLSVILFATVAPFSMYFSGLRQILAIAFVIPAYYFVKKKKWLLFILTVVAAFFFHKSALVLLILYPIYRIKISRNMAYVAIPVLAAVLVFNQQIFLLLLRFLGDEYMERYSDMTATGAYTVLFLLIVFAVYSYFIPDEEKLDDDARGLRNILLLAVAIQCFAPIHTLAMRMNYYFLIFIPILIPKIVVAAKDTNKKLARMSVVVMSLFFTAWFFFNAYTSGDMLQVFPYIPFWS